MTLWETSPLASNTLEAGSLVVSEDPRPAPGPLRPWSIRATISVAAPVLAAPVALLVHRLLPVREVLSTSWLDKLLPWQHPYPILLTGLLAVSVLLALAQWAWTPFRPWVLHYAPLLAGALVWTTLWEIATSKTNWMPHPYFPGPDEVLGGMIEDWKHLLFNTKSSLLLLLSGYATGVCLGLISGVLMGWFPNVRYWGVPVMKVFGPLPATALVPLAMMLSNNAFLSGTVLIAFAVWFPVTMLTSSGIANVRLSYLDVARTLGANRRYLIFRVALPSALPNIFIGLFMGLNVSFLTLMVAETVGVKAGLGAYLQEQKSAAEYDKVYASLFIMAVFFSSIMTLLFVVRDRLLKWQKGVLKW